MRIAALSDLHIGATAPIDGFRHSERQFHDFLDSLERDHDKIVLLGDVFQAEHGWSHSRAVMARELRRAQARVGALWRRLSGPRYIYIHGNHDIVARELGAREDYRVELDGFGVYFVHGHQFDPLLRWARPLARTATWLSGRLRVSGLRGVADWLEHQDVRIKHERFKGPNGPYAEAAQHLLASQRVDVVVMGHTHVPTRVDLAGGVYANTGTCSMGQVSYVSVDLSRRRVALHQR